MEARINGKRVPSTVVEVTLSGVRLRSPTDEDLPDIEYDTPGFRAARLAQLQASVAEHNRRIDNAEKRAARRALRKSKR